MKSITMKNSLLIALLITGFTLSPPAHSQTCEPPPPPAEPPPVELDPDTNIVAVDDPNDPEQIDLANLMLDYEQAADTIENDIDLASAYGEEPLLPDPEDPDGYITGNEYLEDYIPADYYEFLEEWREAHPESEGAP
jgi:hypothetical protein